ncbi:hypothetical protein [Natronolimnobius sp. AArcel1]|uniref:hypothetical protein n=1 Tax=Natronolimnobius sp. AArcel1 TaxID=1679093 RepID=UPI0019CF5F65|nr:hypothetical protein [Natronolimnobius sp. AArcel1]
MFPASIPSDPLTLLAALFTLFGLPLIIFSLVLFYAGYIRHDADQALEALEAELDEQDADRAAADDARDSHDERDSQRTPVDEPETTSPLESAAESAHAPADGVGEPRDGDDQTRRTDDPDGR